MKAEGSALVIGRTSVVATRWAHQLEALGFAPVDVMTDPQEAEKIVAQRRQTLRLVLTLQSSSNGLPFDTTGVIQEATQGEPPIPTIAMTPSKNPGDIVKALTAGASVTVELPERDREIEAAVANIR